MNYNTTPFRLAFTAATLVMSMSNCAAPSYVSRVTQAVVGPVVHAGKAEADDILFEKKWILRGPLYAVGVMSAYKAVDAICDSLCGACGAGLAALFARLRRSTPPANPGVGEDKALYQAVRATFFAIVSATSFLAAHYWVPQWQHQHELRQQQVPQEVVAPAGT